MKGLPDDRQIMTGSPGFHPEDTGCIIGREGNNIKALRNLVASYAIVNDDKRKIFVEVDSNEDIQLSDSY